MTKSFVTSRARKGRRRLRLTLGLTLSAAFLLLGNSQAAHAKEGPDAADRPNILLIVADDLGWSDLHSFGGEIDTPNLDRLAQSGLLLTQFHTSPTCSPTRAMLLSGLDPHRAGLGSMAETLTHNQRGQPGYEGYLRSDVPTIAERLRATGYRTLFSGKWHLGVTPQQDPFARGFDRSFAMLQASHNHFGRGPSSDRARGPAYTENGELVTSLPDDFYSSDFFAAKLISQMQETRQAKGGRRPFFAYLAFTAPHWPLQAPAATIAKYRGRYDEGFDVIRQRRIERQRALGIVGTGVAAHTPRSSKGGWDWLSAEQKRTAARDMEIYAAMVDRLDQNVGKVIDALRRSGELDRTLIVFLADNGAEGLEAESPEAVYLKERLARADNSMPSRGGPTSLVTYGPSWAQVGTAPWWGFKGYSSEGGTRSPAIVSWNGLARHGIGDVYLSAADIAPTLLEIAGGRAGGHRTAVDMTGRSWLPYLAGRADHVYGPEDSIGGELFGCRALRQGNWKITDMGDGQWRLYDMVKDPGETEDLAASDPARVARMAAAWDVYARENGVILPEQRFLQP